MEELLPLDMCFYIENILKKDRLWKARDKIKDSKFIEFHVKIVKYLKQTNETSLYRSLDCPDSWYITHLLPAHSPPNPLGETTMLYFKQEEIPIGHHLYFKQEEIPSGHHLDLKKLRTFNWNFLSIV